MATFGEDRPTRRCSWPSLRRQLIAYPLCGPQALVRSDQMLYENPDLYDALLPVSENQLNFYVTLAQRSPGGVLELGCGSGQLIVPIAAKSMPAVGLDTSHEMLAAARVARAPQACESSSSRETCGASSLADSFR